MLFILRRLWSQYFISFFLFCFRIVLALLLLLCVGLIRLAPFKENGNHKFFRRLALDYILLSAALSWESAATRFERAYNMLWHHNRRMSNAIIFTIIFVCMHVLFSSRSAIWYDFFYSIDAIICINKTMYACRIRAARCTHINYYYWWLQ